MCVYPVGAEAVPDLDLTKRKFCFNIILPSSDEAKELRLYFDTVRSKEKKRESGGREENEGGKDGREGGEKKKIACSFYMYICIVFFTSSSSSKVDEYSSWMAGCRMAIKGRPLVKQGYEQELSSIKAFVSMQNTSETGPSATTVRE